MKIDPYNTKERYLSWKEKTRKGIPEISKHNSNLLKQYLEDMEKGINISIVSKKGSRSYMRLNALRMRILFIIKSLEKKFNLDKITNVKEEQLHNFFSDMKNGIIKRKDNKEYKSVGDYVKDFKAFWHWYQKVSRKKGIEILDITLDLDTAKEKPSKAKTSTTKIKIFKYVLTLSSDILALLFIAILFNMILVINT